MKNSFIEEHMYTIKQCLYTFFMRLNLEFEITHSHMLQQVVVQL